LRVTVLLFSSYAEAFGSNSVDFDLQPGARVGDLLRHVQESARPRQLPNAMVAVNQEYAPANQALRSGDEIAIIPPVAGG
jgi:molybdopterin converting factor subunit 1